MRGGSRPLTTGMAVESRLSGSPTAKCWMGRRPALSVAASLPLDLAHSTCRRRAVFAGVQLCPRATETSRIWPTVNGGNVANARK
jgi:hypothetical protein